MEIIRYLGDNLATYMGISPIASRGLLKLSIKDELGPFIDFKKITYNDLSKVINSSFKNRLIKLEISRYQAIINFILDELSKNQSLSTIADK
ncbi:MAG: hypothetical protein ACFFAS_02325 [Promethearchaeota archaeon]